MQNPWFDFPHRAQPPNRCLFKPAFERHQGDNQTSPLATPGPPRQRRLLARSRREMQMDMGAPYFYAGFHDEIPCFYPHGAAPAASPELLPFGFDSTSPLLEQPGAPELQTSGTAPQGSTWTNVQTREEEERRRRQPAGAVESSRGFRHMMRERQRREKLSQSYADLHAMVAARSKGDKNSIVQSAAIYIDELKGAREQLRRRNEELKARILGHDARQPSVKVDFEVDDPASGTDCMIGALRRLRSMGVKARGIRSSMSGGKLWTEMNVETTIAASDVERAVEEALMKEVERKQQLQAAA